MQSSKIENAERGDESRAARNRPPTTTATNAWMPKSGDGPYCTIPISSGIDGASLKRCGLSSFASARHEIQLLADEYAVRAVALAAKATRERLRLSKEIRGPDGELLIRPNRLRLCLGLNKRENILHLNWRGAAKVRGRWIRYEAKNWSCQSRLDLLIVNTHPAEEQLVRRIEAEATEIRLRWFALVRQVHYMNVVERHRLTDLELDLVRVGGGELAPLAMRLLRRLFLFRRL